jgi:hypothetical protein
MIQRSNVVIFGCSYFNFEYELVSKQPWFSLGIHKHETEYVPEKKGNS